MHNKCFVRPPTWPPKVPMVHVLWHRSNRNHPIWAWPAVFYGEKLRSSRTGVDKDTHIRCLKFLPAQKKSPSLHWTKVSFNRFFCPTIPSKLRLFLKYPSSDFSPAWHFGGCWKFIALKTTMTMEKQPFEDVSPIQTGDFPASHVSFQVCRQNSLHYKP